MKVFVVVVVLVLMAVRMKMWVLWVRVGRVRGRTRLIGAVTPTAAGQR